MNAPASVSPTSSRSLCAQWRVGTFAASVLLVSLVGCGKDGDASPPTEQGGDASAAGGAGSEPVASGGKTTGGMPTNAGAPTTTEPVAGAPSGDAGATSGSAGDTSGGGGAPAVEQPAGGDGLGSADGITGTFAGVAHTATFNAVHVPQQTSTAVIGATTAMYAPYESWRIRFAPKLGTQTCSGGTGPDDSAIDFGSLVKFDDSGTTAGKTCSITITSLAPKYEGTFTATLLTSAGEVLVTEGAFRVPL